VDFADGIFQVEDGTKKQKNVILSDHSDQQMHQTTAAARWLGLRLRILPGAMHVCLL